MKDVRIVSGPFDPGVLSERLAKTSPDAGGVASFLGQVRKGGWVTALELLHYEPLTLPGMEELADDAFARFDLMGLAMVHRVGILHPGDPIVCVAAAARHRRDAIFAVDFCMDHLKSAAWFWKREERAGKWYWIEPREQDHADLARWDS